LSKRVAIPVVKHRSVLTGIQVKETMRRNVSRLPAEASLGRCVRYMIKFKSNAVIVDDNEGTPCGVVSKTDVMGAYYAGFPVETPLQDVLAGSPQFCYPDDDLEDVLDVMQNSGIHRLYVRGADSGEVLGTLAYADIVGLLYRYCRTCVKSRRKARKPDDELPRLHVREVMTKETKSCREDDGITRVIELLSAQRLGAVLITDVQGGASGVISKTDLIIAWIHGVLTDERAKNIMNTPVTSCSSEALLSDAIKQMLLSDVQRLFVHDEDTRRINGVLSLSDAARFRSGTCSACTTSQIMERL